MKSLVEGTDGEALLGGAVGLGRGAVGGVCGTGKRNQPGSRASLPDQLQTGKGPLSTLSTAGPQATMRVFQETEDATKKRKFVKSQVEKRRRERMNCSMERLRTMLLQKPQQMGETQHRVEKAEILEHTVLFLQNTAKGDSTGAGGGGAGGCQKHSFQDGMSTCLQRAARFLGPEGKGLWLGAALDASVAARFSPSDSDPQSAGAQRRAEARSSLSSLPQTKSILQMLRQKSNHRGHTQAFSVNSSAHPYQRPAQQGLPRTPQQAHRQNQLETRVERRAGKQSPSQSRPAGHTLWRPWP